LYLPIVINVIFMSGLQREYMAYNTSIVQATVDYKDKIDERTD